MVRKRIRVRDRGSNAVRCLERVWEMLRQLHPEIPKAVLLVFDTSTRRPRQDGTYTAGYFARSVWRAPGPRKAHEIAISPLRFTSPEDVLETLVHEAAHAALYQQDRECMIHHAGCSPKDHHYHRTEFRDLCREWGLKCSFRNRRYGYSDTSWPDTGVPGIYTPALKHLKAHLPIGVVGEQRPFRSQRKGVRLRCKCADQKRSIYINRTRAELGGISCTLCGHEFRPDRTLQL